jgi:hypothetical protein
MESPRSRRRFTRSALVLGSVAAVVAAGICFGPSHVSVADPDVQVDAAQWDPNIAFPKYLNDELTGVLDKKPTGSPYAKKAAMLRKALENLTNKPPGKNPQPPTTVWGVANAGNYKFNPFPSYFSDKFANKPFGISATTNYYDYSAPDQIWVDFANKKLGGGVFDTGMVQEETMMLEMPQLANAAAKGFITRTGSDPGPLKGDPEPLIFYNVWRSVALAAELYGRAWENWDLDKILKDETPLKNNQQLNVLAMAVPSVKYDDTKAKALETIEDLFNTFVAGYTLATKANKSQVNTGNIGTGDFKNDQETVYVMQKLALQHVGPSYKVAYWGLGGKQVDFDKMATKITDHWGTDKDKSVKHLMQIAHDCLNKVTTAGSFCL